jgi:methionyl-tRNA formyltransferase
MLAVREIGIGAHDTAKSLHDQLARLGAELIVETVEALAQGRVHEVPQPSDGVTYAGKINKAEALIDWREDARQVWRRVRAFNPWPIAETRLNGAQLRIWEAEALDSTPARPRQTAGAEATPSTMSAGGVPGTVLAATEEGIDVACGSGVLRISRLQLAGKKPLFAKEFITGQRLVGTHFAPP